VRKQLSFALFFLCRFLGEQRQQHRMPILVALWVTLALRYQLSVKRDVCGLYVALHFDPQKGHRKRSLRLIINVVEERLVFGITPECLPSGGEMDIQWPGAGD
jgi:hypothetical protein